MSQSVSVNGRNYLISDESMRELVGWLQARQIHYGDETNTFKEIQGTQSGDPRQLLVEKR